MSKEGQVARATRDLAKRLGIPEQEITVQSVQETDWPDASLGAPEHGQVYAQLLVFGYIITLVAHGRTYRYHSDDATRVVAV